MLKILFHLLVTMLIVSQATPLIKTGQTESYNTDGVVVTDGSIKDDGYYQLGEDRNYTRIGDVVVDNVTELEWQDNESARRKWEDDANPNDTASAYCSNFTLDGDGWRLPSIQELETIVDDGVYEPASTSFIFQNIEIFTYYWSSNTFAGDTSRALYMSFTGGNNGSYGKEYSYFIRCVRGEPLDSPDLSRNGKSVSDSQTNLQWQDDEAVKDTTRTWIDSIDYCESLTLDGESDWRLPNKKELLSIVDYSKYYSSINDSIFTNIAPSTYISSTSGAFSPDGAWAVNFYTGYSHVTYKTNESYVRCVRGGELDNSTPSDSTSSAIIMYLLN